MAFATVDSLRHIFVSPSTKKLIKSAELNSLLLTMKRLDDSRFRGIDRSEINELEAKIRDAAWKVEDVIESYQISQGVDEEGLEQEIDSFLKTAEKLRDEYERMLENSRVAVAEEDHIIHDAANSTTVGLSNLSQQIITELLDDSSDSKMVTIWGMAGIGKTHLARDIYHHPLIVQRFELRLWVTIGPNHKDIENIYVDILARISSTPRDRFKEKNKDELRDLLRSSLSDRTYLIVFDDIWSPSDVIDRLDAVLSCRNDRKILMTRRTFNEDEEMQLYNKYRNKIWEVPFLSNEESWNLLSQNVFVDKPSPTQLEKAGRKIAEICEGLPLLILAVADILRGLDQTEECWNKVAEKKTTTFPDAYDRIYKVLVSSYDYLPQKYKACFLYIGVFRQGHEIPVSKLINFWAAEDWYGDHLTSQELWSSCLVIPCKKILAYSDRWDMKSCKLHSAYWYVCVTEARKIKLFHVLNKLTDVSIKRPRRLSVQNNMLFGIKEVYDSMAAATSLTRSLLFTGEDDKYPVQICFNTMLLMKVLDALAIRFYEFPNEVSNLLLLRYLALTHNGEVPSSISKLQRLRFLTLHRHHNIKLLHRDSTCLPNEIWDLKDLWYLRITGYKLPDPSHGVGKRRLSRLYVSADSCTDGVFKSIPYLDKLRIEIELQPEGGTANSLRCLEHIGLLIRLESLKCVVVNPRWSSQVVAPPDHLSNFPRTLQKLSLKGLGYPWEYMSAIGSLSNLSVLKLRCSAFRGPHWKMKDGEFMVLKSLLLEDLDVVHWIVERSFPRSLSIRHCYKLNMRRYMNMPWPCLKLMSIRTVEVDECSLSVMEFAQQINHNPNPFCHALISSSWNL